MDIIDKLQTQFRNANIVEKLIYINISVFLLIFVFNTLRFLFEADDNFLTNWFALSANFDSFISKPWTIITYGFIHIKFIHILFNLIALFFIGNLFLEYFTPKQLVTFYILGTVFGGVIFLMSYNYFPVFANDNSNSTLLGASAGISAIFIGIATYIPNYQFKIPLIGFIKVWYLATFWVVLDIIQIPSENSGGHLAHLGGALFGFLYASQVTTTEISIWKKISSFFKIKQKPLKTVYKTKNNTSKEINISVNQQKINHILEKISKSGYDTLSEEEKAFLFKQGNK